MMKDQRQDLFISYSRRNLQQVIALRDEIKERVGCNSWIDIKGIESGEQFVNVIVKAIDDAKIGPTAIITGLG